MIRILLILVLPVHLSSCAIRSKRSLTPQDQIAANIDHFPFKPEAKELYLVGEIDYVSSVTRDFITTTGLSLTGLKGVGDSPRPPSSGPASPKGGPSTQEPVRVREGNKPFLGAPRPPPLPPPGLGAVPPRKTIAAPSMPIVKERSSTPVLRIVELQQAVTVKHPSSLKQIKFQGDDPVVVVIKSTELGSSLKQYQPNLAEGLSADQWNAGQSFVYDMGEHKVLYTVVGSSDQALTLYGLKLPKGVQGVPSRTFFGVSLTDFGADGPLGKVLATKDPIAKGNQGEVFFVEGFVVKRSFQAGFPDANEARMTALAAEIGVGPKLYAAWIEGSQGFIIQQRLSGKTLEESLGKSKVAGKIVKQIPDAIQTGILTNIDALSNIRLVHGDLHGGNIMVDGPNVRLLDFGSSRIFPNVEEARVFNLEHVLSAIAAPEKNASILFAACLKAGGCGPEFKAQHFSYGAEK